MRLLFIVCFVLQLSAAFGQVAIAPTALFLDKNGLGNLYISNNSNTPQEITVNFQFGYSDQDENGVLIMVYDDTAHARTHGLHSYVRAFPRSFTLAPKQQQLVRVQARVPKSLPAGTYFSRIKIGSTQQSVEVGSNENGISTRINVKFEQVIVCLYKHAEVKTGLVVGNLTAKRDSNFIDIRYNYNTTGNSPYMGKVKVVVKGPTGEVMGEASQSVAMYFSSKRRIGIPLKEGAKAGRYEIEMRFETQRSDMASDDMVQAPPYVYRTAVIL